MCVHAVSIIVTVCVYTVSVSVTLYMYAVNTIVTLCVYNYFVSIIVNLCVRVCVCVSIIIISVYVCVHQLATVYELDAVCLFGMEKKQHVTITMKGIGECSRRFHFTLSLRTL